MIANNGKFTRHNGQLSHQFFIGEINFLGSKKILRKILEPKLASPYFIFISNKNRHFFYFELYETPLWSLFRTFIEQTGVLFALLERSYGA